MLPIVIGFGAVIGGVVAWLSEEKKQRKQQQEEEKRLLDSGSYEVNSMTGKKVDFFYTSVLESLVIMLS